VPGLELDAPLAQLPEAPVWLVEELDRLTGGARAVVQHPGVGNPIPEGQRDNTLNSLTGTMRRVGMTPVEIAAALTRVNVDRCIPPLPQSQVERIAANGGVRYEPSPVATALVENHWGQMYGDQPAEDTAEEAPDVSDPGPTPDELLCIPGFIDEVMQYTLGTAPYPERTLAFAGALALQALLAGRKVRDTMDNRTNLYVLSLANSGVGKDHARKVNARILYEAGLADCLGTSFASGEGIEDRLHVQPATLFQVDELDGILLKVSQARDARHEAIVSMLLQMYSAASSVYIMRAKAERERAEIDQPCLCIFGTAVPKHFYESLSSRLMTNGFLARLLILETGKRGQGQDATVRDLPASVVEIARWWAEYTPGKRRVNLAHWHPAPRVVEHTTEAGGILREFRQRADEQYSLAEDRGDPAAMAIWARANEKARRLSLVYACSANHLDPQIDAGAARWACAFVEHQTRRMLFMAKQYASESEFDAKRKRLLEVLDHWRRQHGDEWMPFWRINRKLPWPQRDHEEVRSTLLQQQLIEYRVMTTRGRPSVGYRLAVLAGAGPADTKEETHE
jgi:hypothetical protein